MKNLNKKTAKFLFVLFIGTLFSSCTRNETSSTPNNTIIGNSDFSYKVAGVSKSVDSANSTLYTSSLTGLRLLDVYAYKTGKLVLEMHFAPKTGSQTVGNDLSKAWLTVVTGTKYPDDVYNCTTGIFQLSVCDTINNKLTGTFSFTGSNGTSNISVTDGILVVNKMVKQ
jgi:hypothetical protein